MATTKKTTKSTPKPAPKPTAKAVTPKPAPKPASGVSGGLSRIDTAKAPLKTTVTKPVVKSPVTQFKTVGLPKPAVTPPKPAVPAAKPASGVSGGLSQIDNAKPGVSTGLSPVAAAKYGSSAVKNAAELAKSPGSWMIPAAAIGGLVGAGGLAANAATKALPLVSAVASRFAPVVSRGAQVVNRAAPVIEKVKPALPTVAKLGAVGGITAAVIPREKTTTNRETPSNVAPTAPTAPNTTTPPVNPLDPKGQTSLGGPGQTRTNVVNNMGEPKAPTSQPQVPGTTPTSQQTQENTMGTTPTTGVASVTTTTGDTTTTTPDFNNMQEKLFKYIDDAMDHNAVLSKTYLDSMTTALNELEAKIMQMYKDQGSEIDPATQAALKSIRDQVDLRRKGLMEEMNRRGLLQSGIWLEEENKILKNQLDAEDQLLAGRLSDIQNRMTDAIIDFAKQRMNIMGTSMQNAMETAQWGANQKINAASNLYNQQIDWSKWWADQQAKQKAAAQEQANKDRDYQLDREQLNLEKSKLANTAAKNTTTPRVNSITQQYINQIASYPDKTKALSEFYRYQPLMKGAGADTDAIYRAIMEYFGQ